MQYNDHNDDWDKIMDFDEKSWISFNWFTLFSNVIVVVMYNTSERKQVVEHMNMGMDKKGKNTMSSPNSLSKRDGNFTINLAWKILAHSYFTT